MEILKKEAIQSYRALLRAQRRVFEGDQRVLNEAWMRTRREFESNRSLSDPDALQTKINEAKQVTQFLSQNLIQGRLADKTFKVKLTERLEMHDYQKNGRPTCGCC